MQFKQKIKKNTFNFSDWCKNMFIIYTQTSEKFNYQRFCSKIINKIDIRHLSSNIFHTLMSKR